MSRPTDRSVLRIHGSPNALSIHECILLGLERRRRRIDDGTGIVLSPFELAAKPGKPIRLSLSLSPSERGGRFRPRSRLNPVSESWPPRSHDVNHRRAPTHLPRAGLVRSLAPTTRPRVPHPRRISRSAFLPRANCIPSRIRPRMGSRALSPLRGNLCLFPYVSVSRSSLPLSPPSFSSRQRVVTSRVLRLFKPLV